MKNIHVYKQYFSAECTFGGITRHGAVVWLTAESDSGMIRYEVGVTFFPHTDEEDFAVSYDACAQKELFCAKGRRSKKKDEQYLAQVRTTVEEIAAALNGTVHWEQPLGDAQYG